jgi:hypothetical protein
MNTKKQYKSRKALIITALAVLVAAGTITAVQAFFDPTQDPSTAGFRSPCGQSMSKDDSCTFSRTTDSMEAIRDKVETLTP